MSRSVLDSQNESDEFSDSEESYENLFSKQDFELFVTYLSSNVNWMLLTTMASVFYILLIPYYIVFGFIDIIHQNNLKFKILTIVVTLICVIILIVDTISAAIHAYWPKYSALKDKQPRNKIILAIEMITCPILVSSIYNIYTPYSKLPPGEKTKIMTDELFRLQKETIQEGIILTEKQLVELLSLNSKSVYEDVQQIYKFQDLISIVYFVIAGYNMHRIIRYFYVISKTSGTNKIQVTVQIYGISTLLLHHVFVCIWRKVSCPGLVCIGGNNWNQLIRTFFSEKDEKNLKAHHWYIICSYYVGQGLSGDAFGDIYPTNLLERIITIIIMIIGYLILSGTFIGGCTSLCLENYRSHSSFVNRLTLIKETLVQHNFPKKVANKIINFYYTFWTQRSAIRIPLLNYILPPSIQQQIPLDKFWNAINRSHILKHTHYAFKKAVASVMTTEIYTKGEVIFNQGQIKNCMIYVCKGSLQLLSEEDGESPILTLGIGTVIGETSLFYSCENTNTVVASAYCVIHRLRKDLLWKVAFHYHKLGNNINMHEITEVCPNQYNKQNIINEKSMEKILKVMKTKLNRETSRIVVQSAMEAVQAQSSDEEIITSDLYIISLHEKSVKKNDEVYIQTLWPWIFHPTSKFLEAWDYFIFILLLMIAIIYPQEIAIQRLFLRRIELLVTLVDVVFIIDLVLKIFTGVETERGTVTNVLDIFLIRCRSFTFGLDILSALPFDHMSLLVTNSYHARILSLLSINRLLKINRAYNVLNKLGESLHLNVALMRCVKYVTYIYFLSYFFGSILYILACFYEKCINDGWFVRKQALEARYGGTLTENPFLISLYFAMAAVTQIGFAVTSAYNTQEMVALSIIFFIGTLAFCYLVADYSATLMLADTSKHIYIEIVDVVRNYLQANDISPSIQNRWNNYLKLQWHFNKGYKIITNRHLLFDLPHYLKSEETEATYSKQLLQVPFFKSFSKDSLSTIAASCETLVLPANEIVLYAGDICHSLFIIEKGFCETVSSATGKIEKLLGPNSHFGAFEMFLGKPGLFSIRTVTDTLITRVTREIIVNAIGTYPNLKRRIDEAVAEVKDSFVVHKHFHEIKQQEIYDYFQVKENKSFFYFPRNKLHPLNIDYNRGFEGKGYYRLVRCLLMRHTIYPDGNFAFAQSIIRALLAFLAAMLFPSMIVLESYYSWAPHFLLIFNILAFVDMYLRLSMCYYDERGLLITHPIKTAKHYFFGPFFLDFLAAFPLSYLLRFILNVNSASSDAIAASMKYVNIAAFTHVLQIHRIPDSLDYFEKDEFSAEKTIIIILKLLPILVVVFNGLTIILLLLTCTIVKENNGFNFQLNEINWFVVSAEKFSTNGKTTMHIYFTALYWIMQMATTVSFADISAVKFDEVVLILFVILIGYFCMNYLLVAIMSGKGSVNLYLTMFRDNMLHLKTFMKRLKITRDLQRQVIQHYENIWYRTRGIRPERIVERCYIILLEDTVLQLYGNTFNQIPIFSDLGRSFYRLLGRHINENYYTKNYEIFKVNDVIPTLYIIQRGTVTVYGPDGSKFAELTKGCIFGNIDNVPATRSTVSAICKTDIDILWIKTDQFYKLTNDYPAIKKRITKHIVSENSYFIYSIQKTSDDSLLSESSNSKEIADNTQRSVFEQESCIKKFKIIATLVTLFSCVITPYHIGFQNHAIWVLMVSYCLDFCFIIVVVIFFYLPFKNEKGDVITDRKLIKSRYIRNYRLYNDLMSLIPFEVFAFCFPDDVYFYVSWFRINRLLRLFTLHHFISLKFDSLNINVLFRKLLKNGIYFAILIHTGACLLHYIAYDKEKTSWLYTVNSAGKSLCTKNVYSCSVYFMVSIMTGTGFGDVHARRPFEMIIVTLLTLVGRVYLGMLVADHSSVIQYYLYNLKNYDYELMKFLRYLKNSFLSPPLVKNIENYAVNLFDRERGFQIPVFVENAPKALREILKNEAFHKHIYDNYMFSSCHVDFIRLLVSKLKTWTFFTGNIICEEGEVNETMYFVHQGAVEQFIIENNAEVHSDVLRNGDCFGIVQGLFAYTPHTHSYRAIAVTYILTLTLKDWAYLLNFFPASRYSIYDRIYHM